MADMARDIYNGVLRFVEMTEGRFTALYNMAVSELCSEYGKRFVLCRDADKVKTVNDEAVNFPEYNGAIINNILFLDDAAKTINKEMSISQSKSAYQNVWMDLKKEKFARPGVWL